MKLATYRDGSRDGQLVVVSRDLTQAHYATGIAGRLQQVLDDWNFLSPQLQALSQKLAQGRAPHAFAFDPARCMAPLPRAFQAFAAAAQGPSGALALSECGSRGFAAPRTRLRPAVLLDELRLAPGLAVLAGDLPARSEAAAAAGAVRLLALAVEVCAPPLLQRDRAGGGGPLQGRLATVFAPVAVTPDELGVGGWQDGRARLQLRARRNEIAWPARDAADGPAPEGFGGWLAHACAARGLDAGSLLWAEIAAGAGRARAGADPTLQPGDEFRLEARDAGGQDVFGAVELSWPEDPAGLPEDAEAPSEDLVAA
ncbi:MAG: fumarylacetoacetate hydrolase family protein [Xylophilus ampelinus]